jgi:rod shape determining protein RodA
MTWRDFDYPLLILTVLLIGLGLIMISSTTEGALTLRGPALRQTMTAVVGLSLMMVLALVDYRVLGHLRNVIFGTTILLLSLVIFMGQITHGSQRWLDLGLFPLQPSELSKVLIVLVLASYLAYYQESLHRLRYVLLSFVYVAPPVLLIYLQPDLGTSLVVAAIWLVMLFVAGMRVRHMLLLALLGLVGAPFAWYRLQGYMRARLILFLRPGLDPSNRYNIDQALISIGSGGWLGKGLLSGSQSQLHFLRVRHTDYIFSALGEELGFVGTVLVVLLLMLVVLRLLQIAERARGTFGGLIACGAATMIGFQSIVNIGVNVGLLPVVGIPLPFVSYGGSSLISILMAEGLAQSVALHRRKIDFELRAPTAQLEIHP